MSAWEGAGNMCVYKHKVYTCFHIIHHASTDLGVVGKCRGEVGPACQWIRYGRASDGWASEIIVFPVTPAFAACSHVLV